jgi:hypothetical protein
MQERLEAAAIEVTPDAFFVVVVKPERLVALGAHVHDFGFSCLAKTSTRCLFTSSSTRSTVHGFSTPRS